MTGNGAEGKNVRENIKDRINSIGLLIKYRGERIVKMTIKHLQEWWHH